jgi:hypothetical protein
MMDEWMTMESQWTDADKENQSTLEENQSQ